MANKAFEKEIILKTSGNLANQLRLLNENLTNANSDAGRLAENIDRVAGKLKISAKNADMMKHTLISVHGTESKLYADTQAYLEATEEILILQRARVKATAAEKRNIDKTIDALSKYQSKIKQIKLVDIDNVKEKARIAREQQIHRDEFNNLDTVRNQGFLDRGVFSSLKTYGNQKFNEVYNEQYSIYTDLKKAGDLARQNLSAAKTKKAKKTAQAEVDRIEAEEKATKKSLTKIAIGQAAFNSIGSTIKKVGKIGNQVFSAMGLNIKGMLSEVMNRVAELLGPNGVASYNMSTSLFTNSSARNMSMQYGLNSGQTYALTNTMKMLGMSSDDDLMYMNGAQKQKFNELMTKYNNWYDQMQSTGTLNNIQNMQLDLKMFKEEMATDLLTWFANNKGLIQAVMSGTLWLLKAILSVLGHIAKAVGFGYKSTYNTAVAAASGAIASDASNNYNKTNNLYINNQTTANANIQSGAELTKALNDSYGNMVKQLAATVNGF